jgi:hypothetical protein
MSSSPAPGVAADSPLGRAERALVLALAVAATGALCWNASRLAFLGDDAFISFRYARHLAEGLGLVWNPGERVEGYTNFLWVVLLSSGMRVGLEPELLAQVLGLASGALVCVALLRLGARGSSAGSLWAWLPVSFLCLGGSFAAWCTGGLETMFFTLLVFLGFGAASARPSRPLATALALAAAALTRPEGLLFASLASLWLAGETLPERRRRTRTAAALALLWGVILAHLFWRRTYYGYWLPNTFYAKVPAPWLEQGLEYFRRFQEQYRLAWFLPLWGLALLGKHRREALLALAFTLPYLGYVLAVGGDQFEYRFLVPVLPLAAWLFGQGLRALHGRLRDMLPRPVQIAATALPTLLLLLAVRAGYERHRGEHSAIEAIEHYATRRSEEGRFLRACIERGLLPRQVVLAVSGAGAVPYYTGWTTVDCLGLNDEHIAHLPLAERGLIGHERWAAPEYLDQRGVVVFDVYNRLLHEALPRPRGYQGRRLAIRAIPLEGRYLVFATFAGDEELRRLFPGLELVSISG